MAREPGKLTALAVARAKAPGLYSDGGGLNLQIAPSGARSWIFRFQQAGRRRYMGLGGAAHVALAEARQKAADARKVLGEGKDPIEAARAQVVATAAKKAKATTFREAANRYIASHATGWRNAKHAAQWQATLETYAFPVLGGVSVAAVDVAMVLKVLEPIWTAKTETARRLRGRIEAILDWAAARNMRTGDNPARWRGLLMHLLPKRSKAATVKHHPALPYARMGEFMAATTFSGARIPDPDGGPHVRGYRRPLARNRHGQRGMDCPGGSDQGGQGASRSVVRARARNRSGDGRNAPR